jgi:hypothetical protein
MINEDESETNGRIFHFSLRFSDGDRGDWRMGLFVRKAVFQSVFKKYLVYFFSYYLSWFMMSHSKNREALFSSFSEEPCQIKYSCKRKWEYKIKCIEKQTSTSISLYKDSFLSFFNHI